MQKTLMSKKSELGKKSEYDPHYNPEKLFPIPRIGKREEIGIDTTNLPFFGFDCWNHYEVSWLNEKGKPVVALAEIVYGCESPNIIESKSMKLYFNSFNNTKFSDKAMVESTIKRDIGQRVGSRVFVKLSLLDEIKNEIIYNAFDGICIDYLDVECNNYIIDTNLLTTEAAYVEEKLHSNLLKSNCLITNQPDWGSIQIIYKGNKIKPEGLLKYIISFRNHNEFHEQCIERIFVDIMKQCNPKELTIYGRYTRRGGLDINPYRSTNNFEYISNINNRLCRQ